MITQIFLQLDNVSGIQLKVFNELKKHHLRTVKHVIKDGPNGGKLLAMEVESEEAIAQDAIHSFVAPIAGVTSVLKVAAKEVETGPNAFQQAQELMLNSMQAFANSVRNTALVREISEAESQEQIKALIDRWYSAISDNPDGVQRIDELKADLLKILK